MKLFGEETKSIDKRSFCRCAAGHPVKCCVFEWDGWSCMWGGACVCKITQGPLGCWCCSSEHFASVFSK